MTEAASVRVAIQQNKVEHFLFTAFLCAAVGAKPHLVYLQRKICAGERQLNLLHLLAWPSKCRKKRRIFDLSEVLICKIFALLGP